MAPITEEVRKRIRVLFPEHQWLRVESLLEERCSAGLPLAGHLGDEPGGFDRVHLAVLKLSRGSLEQLKLEIEGARRDWRDTLVAAGFGNDLTAHERWLPEAGE
jgi:hypothetical protein